METLSFLKFWKPNTNIPSPVAEAENEVDGDDDEEDSFFDLELNAPDFDNKKNNTIGNDNDFPDEENTRDAKGLGFSEEKIKSSDKTAGDRRLFCPKPAIPMSAADPISKRKILPLEPISKPQSPIALLRSAPKFRVLMFKKPKPTAATQKTEKTGEAEARNILMETQKKQKQEGKLFTVKFNVDEDSNLSKLNRESSLRRNGSKPQNQSSDDSRTERKDVLQKYLKLIKPLYVKASKRYSEKMKFQSDLSAASPASSPVPAPICSPKEKQGNISAGIRNVCKHLGKSKSASGVSATVPTNRRDDSLLQQHDGIQSAILHCKKSFNSSRDSSSLSRSTSDSSSMKSCFSDSSLLSHFISESSQDRSARSSIEDNYGVVGI